jgi:aspartate 1-decarboxylase
MLIEVLKSKIHRVRVTEANLNYIGSVTIMKKYRMSVIIIKIEKNQTGATV